MVCHTLEDIRSEEQLSLALNSVIAAKQTGLETVLAPLIAKACLTVIPPAPKRPSLNVDNVRVCKLIGGSTSDSTVIKGVVVQRTSEVSCGP
jgi:T-complex protein 1 subunit theta